MLKRILSSLMGQAMLLLCLTQLPAITLAGTNNGAPPHDSIPRIKNAIDTSLLNFRMLFSKKPLLKFNGGIVNYSFFYRANIDTPYAQKNVMQHTVTGNVNFTVAGNLPFRLIYLARNSNSEFFRDIYDVRAEFDANVFRDRLVTGLRQEMMDKLDSYKDSLTDKLFSSKLTQWNELKDWLSNPLTMQRVYEMNEIARMPELTYNKSLPDSTARKISDSLQQGAKQFLSEYGKRKAQYNQLTGTVDSLKKQIRTTIGEINQLKQILNGKQPDWASFAQLKQKLGEKTGKLPEIPKQLTWLLGVRKLSLGRSPVNYSELTAKNISLNGINFEYNSWYYFAVTAGLIDYRFRDFSLQSAKRPLQYMYMVRLGLGQLERNYFIVSLFNGRKQLYTTQNASKGIPVTGLSIETKYQLARSTYIVAEAAQSVSPDFNYNPPADKKFFDLTDRSNKAVAVKLYSFIHRTNSRIEGLYKYTGANYQSFTSFQTNSALVSWYLRADQQFFKRQLKITGSLRSNEFSNPYIVQQYKTNSVFKSLQVSFRKRRWPVASIGYMPVSQFTKLDNQIFESRFQTLNANLSHIYKLGTKQTATSIIVSKFYNSQSDSAFTYYNALNMVISQSFFFKSFNASINISQTKNPGYLLNVLDGNIQVPVSVNASFSVGAKVNNLNRAVVKTGYYGSAQLRFRQDQLYVSFEKGYLPGAGVQLIKNDFLTVSFSKHF